VGQDTLDDRDDVVGAVLLEEMRTVQCDVGLITSTRNQLPEMHVPARGDRIAVAECGDERLVESSEHLPGGSVLRHRPVLRRDLADGQVRCALAERQPRDMAFVGVAVTVGRLVGAQSITLSRSY
jgi:hypothetical protein